MDADGLDDDVGGEGVVVDVVLGAGAAGWTMSLAG